MNKKKRQKLTNINKAIIAIILTATFLISTKLLAHNLSSAKSNGLVGETDSGYLAAVESSDLSLNNFVKDINKKRKLRYQAIANKNGVSLNTVEQQAGGKLIRKISNGEYVRISGKWKKK
ncbi:MAG: YdbL family protein [Halieaceae bacterium]|nr:YdbL family protein [Halieaceae bacterium]